jgi:DNA-binding NarL/FixJ family response regulator
MTLRDGLDLVLVDPDRMPRTGTALLLRSWGHRVVAVADDARTGCVAIRERRPDVALVDLLIPGGPESLLRAAEAVGTHVVLFLGQPPPRTLAAALASGAHGLALKSADPEELREAISAAGRGQRYVAAGVESLVARRRRGDSGLSNREREVLQLLADGLTGAQASTRLSVSPETLRTHVRNAMRRLGATTRVRAVAIALARRDINP